MFQTEAFFADWEKAAESAVVENKRDSELLQVDEASSFHMPAPIPIPAPIPTRNTEKANIVKVNTLPTDLDDVIVK